jgi:hypothetical protein
MHRYVPDFEYIFKAFQIFDIFYTKANKDKIYRLWKVSVAAAKQYGHRVVD